MSYVVLSMESRDVVCMALDKRDIETRTEAVEYARQRRLKDVETYGTYYADRFFIARDLEEVQP